MLSTQNVVLIKLKTFFFQFEAKLIILLST